MIIKETIKEKGFTLEQVASALGITKSTMSRTIGNNPTVETLRKIAGVIGCTISDFFRDEEPALSGPTATCPHCGKPVAITLSKPEEHKSCQDHEQK